jgi:hypothetical protein
MARRASRAVVAWHGLEEYRAELRELPTALVGEAAKLIQGEANAAFVAIKAAYPSHSGKLRAGMKVEHIAPGDRLKAGSTIKNTTKYAWVYDRGMQARHTSKGWNRGPMPAGNVFIPRIVRARRKIVELVKAMIARHGATRVTGDA